MTTQTTAERMALIRQAAKKFQQKKKLEARFVREEKQTIEDDERHYTDASKYADQHYGQVYASTTKFDREEDSYDGMFTVEDDEKPLYEVFANMKPRY
jgi:hypothetical protein